ncbi:MAG: hypothetical protein K0R43_1719 [Pseudoduganella sp.]|jgi:hypothetical protein|nr:hypothetical protein [Pseudoduganella sp.]
MSDPNELTKRQEIYTARAKTVTIEQLDTAGEILRDHLHVKTTTPELLIAMAQLIATNYATHITDNGLGRIK